MDKGAIRGLRWQDLDLDRDEGRIVSGRFAMQRGKTGKPVRQALTAGAVEALNRARQQSLSRRFGLPGSSFVRRPIMPRQSESNQDRNEDY